MSTAPQTKSECNARHTNIWRAIKLVFGSLLGLTTVACLAFNTAGDAVDKAHEAQERVGEVGVGQTYILQGIDRVEASQIRLENKVDGMNGGGE